MTTINEFANDLERRAAGFRSRGDVIFNGMIMADELQSWAEKAAAISPPEPTEDQRYAKDIADWCQRSLDTARLTGHLETRPFVQNVELIIKALRAYAMPLQDHARDEEIKRLRDVLNGIAGYCSSDGLPVNRTTLVRIRHTAEQALRVRAPMVAEHQPSGAK